MTLIDAKEVAGAIGCKRGEGTVRDECSALYVFDEVRNSLLAWILLCLPPIEAEAIIPGETM